MDRQEMLEIVKPYLTAHRYRHTLGVMHTAIELAHKYGADAQRAQTAAIFHDIAKYKDAHQSAAIIRRIRSVSSDILKYNKELWHAPVGAYLVEKEIGITDIHILRAIRYHTTGREHMSLLEKVVCLADYIEPSRTYPGVQKLRQVAALHIDQALLQALGGTIAVLTSRAQTVYPETLRAYNYLAMTTTR